MRLRLVFLAFLLAAVAFGADFPNFVDVNVGGTRFALSAATLQRHPSSLLAQTIATSPSNATRCQEQSFCRLAVDSVFFDRDADLFGHIARYLRDPDAFVLPPAVCVPCLLREAEFFQLDGLAAQLRAVPSSQVNDEQPVSVLGSPFEDPNDTLAQFALRWFKANASSVVREATAARRANCIELRIVFNVNGQNYGPSNDGNTNVIRQVFYDLGMLPVESDSPSPLPRLASLLADLFGNVLGLRCTVMNGSPQPSCTQGALCPTDLIASISLLSPGVRGTGAGYSGGSVPAYNFLPLWQAGEEQFGSLGINASPLRRSERSPYLKYQSINGEADMQ